MTHSKTNVMINISNHCPQHHDATIRHKLKTSFLKETFGFNLHNETPKTSNIVNNKIELFTFKDNWHNRDGLLDVSTFKISGTSDTISTDFLKHIAIQKKNKKNIVGSVDDIFLSSYDNDKIRGFIDFKCHEKWKMDLHAFKSDSRIRHSNNTTNNIACGKLLNVLLNKCPERFKELRHNKVYTLPFIPNDVILFFYTLTIMETNITKTYKIEIVLV